MHLRISYANVLLPALVFGMTNVVTVPSLQVNSNLDALDQVLDWFESFKEDPLPVQTWLQCQLAIAEGFTNAVRHAHCSLPESTPIRLELTFQNEIIEIRIWDYGPPFDMDFFISTLPETVDTEAEGGRGILLMKAIATQLSYRRVDNEKNCLLIVKDYSEAIEVEAKVSEVN